MVVSSVVHQYYSYNLDMNLTENVVDPKTISNFKILPIIFVEVVTVLFTIYEIQRITPSNGLSNSIALYRALSISPTNTVDLSLPRILNLMRLFTGAVGYFVGFLFMKDIVYRKKINYLYLVVILLSVVSDLMLGSRGGTMTILIGLFVFLYALYKKKKSWKSENNIKLIFGIVGIAAAVILVFQGFANLLGRNTSEYSFTYYLAIYLGAEIKNLDIFLQTVFPIQNGFFGEQTFMYIWKTISPYIGIDSSILQFDLPFLSVNGYSLGNVYTVFYSYLYDFGYIGVPILVSLMAFISQVFFEKFKRFRLNQGVPISVLVYARIFSALAFSFFSNKFYENMFNFSFFEIIVIWILLNWFLCGKSLIKISWYKD